MSSIINTNSLSLLTQNNLLKSQSSLTTAIQRLSSGLRINSAKDDAAGQAIANRFTSSIKGLAQSQRNANDGISLAQTTEGALNEINNNLQRVRELTVQSANGSNSKSDLDSIQSEITQRMAEINRTSAQTDFNGTKVLGETAGNLNIQVGANDGETIKIGLQTINTTTLGLGTGVGAAAVVSFNINGTGTANSAATKNDLLVAGFVANAAAPVNGTQQYDKTTANVVANTDNVFGAITNGGTVKDGAITYTYDAAAKSFSFGEAARTAANTAASLKPAPGGSTSANIKIGATSVDVKIDGTGMLTSTASGNKLYLDATGNLTENGAGSPAQANVNGGGSVATGDLLYSMGDSASATKTGGVITTGSGTSATTYTYAVGGAAAGPAAVANDHISSAALLQKVKTDNTGGAAITVVLGATATNTSGYVAGPPATGTLGSKITILATFGTVQDDATNAVKVNGAGALSVNTNTVESYYEHSNGAVMDNAGNTVYADSANAGKFTLTARSGTTSTVDAMKVIDAALAKVDGLRSSLGAVQNRFDSVISNLGSTITNLSASRSRIEDADYATEVSNMTRAQILQQAGTSVLAKANQSTQGVMSLLQ